MSTGQVGAVVILGCRGLAALARTNDLGVRTELLVHPSVENKERTLPETFISESLAVANDAALHLVDLLKTTLQHETAQYFTTNATGAVGHDGFFF